MRITCPNCGAQYEVPDEVIPHDGRDVQCSNCGLTWFQAHPDNPEPVAAASPDVDPVPEPQPETAPDDDDPSDAFDAPAATEAERRELAPDVADILRQEAEHEAELRAAEAKSNLESQPDLGLDDLPPAAPPETSAADRLAKLRGEAAESNNGSRRDLLPDIDELNSSLRSDGESTALTPHLAEETEALPQSNGGFARGFALTLVFAALVVVVYANAPEISARVPQADGFLNALVTLIDKGRLWLDTQVRAFVS